MSRHLFRAAKANARWGRGELSVVAAADPDNTCSHSSLASIHKTHTRNMVLCKCVSVNQIIENYDFDCEKSQRPHLEPVLVFRRFALLCDEAI